MPRLSGKNSPIIRQKRPDFRAKKSRKMLIYLFLICCITYYRGAFLSLSVSQYRKKL